MYIVRLPLMDLPLVALQGLRLGGSSCSIHLSVRLSLYAIACVHTHIHTYIDGEREAPRLVLHAPLGDVRLPRARPLALQALLQDALRLGAHLHGPPLELHLLGPEALQGGRLLGAEPPLPVLRLVRGGTAALASDLFASQDFDMCCRSRHLQTGVEHPQHVMTHPTRLMRRYLVLHVLLTS